MKQLHRNFRIRTLASIPYTLDPLRSHGLGTADLAAIESGTALRLFPRFAKVTA